MSILNTDENGESILAQPVRHVEGFGFRAGLHGLAAGRGGFPLAMKLADFTSSSLMIPHLGGRDATAIIQELGEVLHREKRVLDLPSFVKAVLSRECLGNTEMEAAMAFPHARLADLPGLSFALGRSDKPLGWGPNAEGRVRLVFLIAAPADDFSLYLPLISGLVRLAKDSRLTQLLCAAPDALQMFEALQRVELPARTLSAAK